MTTKHSIAAKKRMGKTKKERTMKGRELANIKNKKMTTAEKRKHALKMLDGRYKKNDEKS